MAPSSDLTARIAALVAENAELRAEIARRDTDERRRAAQAGYQAKRVAAKARGEWKPYADAGPVRGHIRHVMKTGRHPVSGRSLTRLGWPRRGSSASC